MSMLNDHFNRELSSFDSNPETKPVYDGRIQLMGDKAVLVYFLSLCPKMNVGANRAYPMDGGSKNRNQAYGRDRM